MIYQGRVLKAGDLWRADRGIVLLVRDTRDSDKLTPMWLNVMDTESFINEENIPQVHSDTLASFFVGASIKYITNISEALFNIEKSLMELIK